MSDYDAIGPTTMGYPLSYSGYEYLRRLLALGAIEGPIGDQRVTEALEPVVDAMHHVLAGGAVSIEVTRRGDPDIVNELRGRVAEATREGNAINEAAGFYMTALP